MNGEEIKKVVREAYELINSVQMLPPMGIDNGFHFVSEDEEFWIRFSNEDDYKIVQTGVLALDDPGFTLEELDKQGVQWNFTQGVMDLLSEIVMDAQDHIQQHERDVEKFSNMVDNLSGEMILGCL